VPDGRSGNDKRDRKSHKQEDGVKGKIALEEHFAIQETLQDSAIFVPGDYWEELKYRLFDFHEKRLKLMDEYGIEMMLLSLNAPAVQAIPDPKKAHEIARRANDFLAEQVAKRPDRFQGLAALAMQDPDVATRELQRCIKDLGFKGALVNGFSQVVDPNSAVYYDLKQYWPFWAEVEKLDVPFYLHPRNPLASDARIYEGHSWLMGPTWAFGHETATHALRLMGSGLFDEYPRLAIISRSYGRGIALQCLACRQPQRLGQVSAALSGQAQNGRLFSAEFLRHDVGKFPQSGAGQRDTRDWRRASTVLHGLALREYRSRRRLVRPREHQRQRSPENRPHQRNEAIQIIAVAD
jgi:predicted TIM-barrel fold metal-dependent hydrolase